jgi:hypothetical protein
MDEDNRSMGRAPAYMVLNWRCPLPGPYRIEAGKMAVAEATDIAAYRSASARRTPVVRQAVAIIGDYAVLARN